MFTALALSMTLSAPVPAPAAPVATGAAPQVLELKPDANGKILVTVTRTEMQKVNVAAAIGNVGGAGGPPPAVATREIPVTRHVAVELGEVKNLTVTTADGKKVETEDALKRVAGGAVVVIPTDGKPVSPAFLKVFKDDTLVFVSPEFVAPAAGLTRPGFGGAGGVRPLPAIAPGGIQIQPGNVQIIPGGNIQVLPIQGGGAGGVIQVQIAPAVPAVDKLPEKK